LAPAQELDTHFWVPDGEVRSIVRSGSTIYLGGVFSEICPNVGSAAAINATTAAIQEPYGLVNGRVFTVIPDASGGWFVGGLFTMVQGKRIPCLAHLDANGEAYAWTPLTGGTVQCLAFVGSTLYVGGYFSVSGLATPVHLAAFNLATGTRVARMPNVQGSVTALAASGTTLYVAGSFSQWAGRPRKPRCDLLTSYNVKTWAPAFLQRYDHRGDGALHGVLFGSKWRAGERAALMRSARATRWDRHPTMHSLVDQDSLT
jgi:hypothetical protein